MCDSTPPVAAGAGVDSMGQVGPGPSDPSMGGIQGMIADIDAVFGPPDAPVSPSQMTPPTFNLMPDPDIGRQKAFAHFNMTPGLLNVMDVLASLMGPAGTPNPLGLAMLGTRGALALHGEQSVADVFAAANAPGVSSDPGSSGPLVIGGPAEMTTRSLEGALAPGGAIATAANAPGGIGATTGTPTQAQRANASARGLGGLSPGFLENLALVGTLE